ncbi:helix-turn-helix domain-containing protein [Leptospira alstonii]|nr:helix-turn-helix domain-containing protein [Leptospira alstonii]
MIKKKSNNSRNSNQEKGMFGYTKNGSLLADPTRVPKLGPKNNSSNLSDAAVPKNPLDTMTPKEVAALLKRTIRRVGDYRREGLLGKFWRLTDGSILYSRAGVEEFFKSHFVETEELSER